MRTAVIIMAVVIFILCFVLMPIMMWTAPYIDEDDSSEEEMQKHLTELTDDTSIDTGKKL